MLTYVVVIGVVVAVTVVEVFNCALVDVMVVVSVTVFFGGMAPMQEQTDDRAAETTGSATKDEQALLSGVLVGSLTHEELVGFLGSDQSCFPLLCSCSEPRPSSWKDALRLLSAGTKTCTPPVVKQVSVVVVTVVGTMTVTAYIVA